MTPLTLEIKPTTDYYHYSNAASQGALIRQTSEWPGGYFAGSEMYSSAYSDRMDPKHYEKACAIVGTGDQGWSHNLRFKTDAQLMEFAKAALGLKVLPTHVRCVHWYNVSSGFSVPTVEAIYPKS